MRSNINLIPPTMSREFMLRRRLTQWGKAIAATVVVVWFTYWTERQIYEELMHELWVVEREYTPAQEAFRDVVDLRAQIDKLTIQESVLGAIDRQRQVVTLLGVISQGAAACDGKIQVTKLALTDFQASGASRAGSDSRAGSVTLSGVSLDSLVVTQFVANLQESGLFANVDVVRLQEQPNTPIKDYEILCEL